MEPSRGAVLRPQSGPGALRAHSCVAPLQGARGGMTFGIPGVALRYTPGYGIARLRRAVWSRWAVVTSAKNIRG